MAMRMMVLGGLALSCLLAPALPVDAGEAQAAKEVKAFAKRKKPCGSAADVYFCLRIEPTDVEKVSLPAFSVDFPGAGAAVVTWNGTVFCEITDRNDANPTSSYTRSQLYVHLALKDDNSDITINEEGATSLGVYHRTGMIYAASSSDQTPAYLAGDKNYLVPVSLTRVFDIKKKSTSKFRTFVLGDFRIFSTSGPKYCNVNGGAMTVQFTPN